MDWKEAADFLSDDLRLRTSPVAVKFLKDESGFPDKTRRPSEAMGKRITICQAVTMARLFGWTIGLAKKDLICVPAMISFGFTGAADQRGTLGKLLCDVTWSKDESTVAKETESMTLLEKDEYGALVLAPLAKASFEPDTVAIYANPAQAMRMAEAWSYIDGGRVPGNFGGKIECTEYLTAPFKTGTPRMAIPGMGDRIFSMTQDDELVFSIPGGSVAGLIEGLKSAGKKIGAKYPITFYQNFQPEFPKYYKELGDKIDAF